MPKALSFASTESAKEDGEDQETLAFAREASQDKFDAPNIHS